MQNIFLCVSFFRNNIYKFLLVQFSHCEIKKHKCRCQKDCLFKIFAKFSNLIRCNFQTFFRNTFSTLILLCQQYVFPITFISVFKYFLKLRLKKYSEQKTLGVLICYFQLPFRMSHVQMSNDVRFCVLGFRIIR